MICGEKSNKRASSLTKNVNNKKKKGKEIKPRNTHNDTVVQKLLHT